MWLPEYERKLFAGRGAPYRRPGGPTKLLLHTTEGSTFAGAFAAYKARGAINPHITYKPSAGEGYQHVPLDLHSYSLWHVDSWNVVQIEIVGFAAETPSYSDQWYRNLAEHVVAPIVKAYPKITVQSRVDWVGVEGYGRRAKQRLSFDAFDAYDGILGHQHAPAKWWTTKTNTHWDPGKLDIERLIRFTMEALRSPHPPSPEDPMSQPDFLIKLNSEPAIFAVWGPAARHIGPAEFNHWNGKTPLIVSTDQGEVARIERVAKQAEGG